MRRKGYRVRFRTVISKKTYCIISFIFIDDTNLGERRLDNSNRTIEEVIEDMQRSINLQEGYLKAIGGVIRSDKSFAFPIGFIFKVNVNYKFATINEL